ncbi:MULTISPECIES: hypothetical protein [unclassified Bradyrhizobium]|uniref:hypothetical protein n=1 Tax=unclassified Bradyrhizobium TaxID=2631580 RepID=UPI00211EBBB0|nr:MULTISPECIES: hypothetical protein [unclassified Bradyrhizobium]MDD1534581.1 hypothetical protein [Bradyrhizobium sp. WBOS8]MDD1581445.1 hypothetical protein [Bradyrhizobium sp. WBOS4]UUO49732.1 hypothetical protein DCM78_24165 [Bradyrhizobium sp. WBOS04]UUO58498.1 hypothetical protein DCM80_04445 [Bradyrhizobium sp. WBOS08]
MTKYAVARMNRRHPRFFTGRYTDHGPLPLAITTGQPGQARAYDDEAIARLVCSFLNSIAAVMTHGKPWAVLPLPEGRK